jgi:hypothetical protein
MEIGVSLPNDYRDFLLTINGGRPQPNHFFDVHTYVYRRQVDLLFSLPANDGVPADENSSLLEITRKVRSYLNTPLVMAPIGRMTDGSRLAIGVSQENKGQVFLVSDDANPYLVSFKESERLNWMFDDSPIASSFTKFLARLTA